MRPTERKDACKDLAGMARRVSAVSFNILRMFLDPNSRSQGFPAIWCRQVDGSNILEVFACEV